MQFALVLALVSVTPFAQVRVRTDLRPAERAIASTVFSGRVLTPRGLPARAAVVATSAGGETVTGDDGSFVLAVDVPLAAELVEVTAVLDGGAALGTSTASARVLPAALAPTTSVGTLQLVQSPACAP
ncbi:MAG TPA: hypothetical protein VJL86_12865, partial [Steroidobacteraceae bacterium]|nr:hypothetical protein [Steroidobacteraceae bacterium]